MCFAPSSPSIPPAPEIPAEPVQPDAASLARQRRTLEQRRRGRASLRIEPGVNTNPGQGLAIPPTSA